jgi:sugar/nucleoside kinase (ribokinase family)
LIDHVSDQAGIDAAKIARDHGVSVVIDAERETDAVKKVLALVDHIVVPYEFARLCSGANDIEDMLAKMRREDSQTVIITRGSRGCAGLTGEQSFFIPAFQVEAVDTTGCGDVFHGAYALRIAQGKTVVEAARFASAAAALSATQIGGRSGIPRSDEVRRLIMGEEVS